MRGSSGSLVVVSFADGSIAVYDVEVASSQPVLLFENGSSCRVNSVVVHPTLPVIVSAHEDRQIKFWDLDTGTSCVAACLEKWRSDSFCCSSLDLLTGKCLQAMVAHLDEVTSLACDPNGLYLLSGSEYFADLGCCCCRRRRCSCRRLFVSLMLTVGSAPVTSGHDCSVRLWNFDSRTCVQEITSHRKKFDEAIFDVSFHPSKAFFASAGADGLAKVFV